MSKYSSLLVSARGKEKNMLMPKFGQRETFWPMAAIVFLFENSAWLTENHFPPFCPRD